MSEVVAGDTEFGFSVETKGGSSFSVSSDGDGVTVGGKATISKRGSKADVSVNVDVTDSSTTVGGSVQGQIGKGKGIGKAGAIGSIEITDESIGVTVGSSANIDVNEESVSSIAGATFARGFFGTLESFGIDDAEASVGVNTQVEFKSTETTVGNIETEETSINYSIGGGVEASDSSPDGDNDGDTRSADVGLSGSLNIISYSRTRTTNVDTQGCSTLITDIGIGAVC